MNPLRSKSCKNACAATFLIVFSCGTFAQRGGGFHGGGFSGARGGFSAPSSGFSGMRPGFSAPAGGFHSSTAFRSGFFAPRPGFRPLAPHSMPPARFASPSYPVGRMRSVTTRPRVPLGSVGAMRPVTTGPRMPSSSAMYRAPYRSPNGVNRFVHRDGFHNHHTRVVFVSHNHVFLNSFWPFWGWGYPYAYGYPYLSPSIFNDSDDCDRQGASNYATPQPYDNNRAPCQPQAPPAPPETSPQQQP
jgi:hypothetical protein